MMAWSDPVRPPGVTGQKEKSFDFVYVDEESFNRYKPKSFEQLMKTFREFKN